jgi:Insertion element 4 transposase N-terminal
MSRGWSSLRGRLLSRVGIGVLTWVVPPDLVDEAVGDGLAWEMRLRALPARLGVYFVLGLCLFSQLPYGQVLRELTSGLEAVLATAGWQAPATTALTAVRRRIGEKPLESLFRRLCSALSPGRSPWSHICGLLAVAWDGTTMAAEASMENTAAFGKPGVPERRPPRNGTGGDEGVAAADDDAGCPQLRLVTLVACGTRALLDAAAGPLRGKGTGERDLARQLPGSLRAGMLLIAGRGFCSYGLWTAAAGTGADLLWRARNDMHLPVLRELPDGSWLTHVNDPRAVQARLRKNRKRRGRGSPLPPDTSPLPGITVRVIEFTLTVTAGDGTSCTGRYRLLTTLLDHQACPAADLAAGYARRWAIQAIRVIIVRAAAGAGLHPDRISFTAALHAIRRTLPAARDSMDAALASTEAEILTSLIPERQGRIYPRAVNKPISPYPSRRSQASPISQHAGYTITTTTQGTPTRAHTDQAKQPAHRPGNPP